MRLRQYWYRVLVADDAHKNKNSGTIWFARRTDDKPAEVPIPTLAEARKMRTALAKEFGSAVIVRSCISIEPYWKAVVVP